MSDDQTVTIREWSGLVLTWRPPFLVTRRHWACDEPGFRVTADLTPDNPDDSRLVREKLIEVGLQKFRHVVVAAGDTKYEAREP